MDDFGSSATALTRPERPYIEPGACLAKAFLVEIARVENLPQLSDVLSSLDTGGRSLCVIESQTGWSSAPQAEPGQLTILHPSVASDDERMRIQSLIEQAAKSAARLPTSENGIIAKTSRIYFEGSRAVVIDGKGEDFGKLLEDFGAQYQALEKFAEEADTDAVTGYSGHASFKNYFRKIAEKAKESGQPCALIIFDIDQFKPINDKYTRSGGDSVLRQMVDLLHKEFPGSFARIGGDEFAIILPGKNVEEGAQIATELRKRIANAVFAIDIDGCHFERQLTCSLGVSDFDPIRESRFKTDDLLLKMTNYADLGLRTARGGPRVTGSMQGNCVCYRAPDGIMQYRHDYPQKDPAGNENAVIFDEREAAILVIDDLKDLFLRGDAQSRTPESLNDVRIASSAAQAGVRGLLPYADFKITARPAINGDPLIAKRYKGEPEITGEAQDILLRMHEERRAASAEERLVLISALQEGIDRLRNNGLGHWADQIDRFKKQQEPIRTKIAQGPTQPAPVL